MLSMSVVVSVSSVPTPALSAISSLLWGMETEANNADPGDRFGGPLKYSPK
jgi:hypothetical protein